MVPVDQIGSQHPQLLVQKYQELVEPVPQLYMEMRMMWKSWRCCWRLLFVPLPWNLLVTLSLAEYWNLHILAGIFHADRWHIKQIDNGKLGHLSQVHNIIIGYQNQGLSQQYRWSSVKPCLKPRIWHFVDVCICLQLLFQLREYIDDTEDYINIQVMFLVKYMGCWCGPFHPWSTTYFSSSYLQLDNHRNQLIQVILKAQTLWFALWTVHFRHSCACNKHMLN